MANDDNIFAIFIISAADGIKIFNKIWKLNKSQCVFQFQFLNFKSDRILGDVWNQVWTNDPFDIMWHVTDNDIRPMHANFLA